MQRIIRQFSNLFPAFVSGLFFGVFSTFLIIFVLIKTGLLRSFFN